jgi:hypothetical protein
MRLQPVKQAGRRQFEALLNLKSGPLAFIFVSLSRFAQQRDIFTHF